MSTENDMVPVPAPVEVPPATTPFPITRAADRDDMKPFRETARWMNLGDASEGRTVAEASKLAKAIEEKYGERTARIELQKGNPELRTVIRVAPREKKQRKPRTKKGE